MYKLLHTIKRKFHPLKTRARLIRDSWKWQTADIIFILTMIIATMALASLLWYNVRPIKTVDIKVPVATDRSAYAPGEQIGGIFFGEIFYEGDVRVLREVYCKDYKSVIDPPTSAKNGDFYATQSIPRKLDGLSVTIGNLPANIPIGKNCVLQFTNVYDIPTPFGTRHITYSYYTQNFAIVSQERRDLFECEATGATDCTQRQLDEDDPQAVELDDTPFSTPESYTQSTTPRQNSDTAPQSTTDNRTEPSTNRPQNSPPDEPSEPVTPPRRCSIDFLFIHLFCQ